VAEGRVVGIAIRVSVAKRSEFKLQLVLIYGLKGLKTKLKFELALPINTDKVKKQRVRTGNAVTG